MKKGNQNISQMKYHYQNGGRCEPLLNFLNETNTEHQQLIEKAIDRMNSSERLLLKLKIFQINSAVSMNIAMVKPYIKQLQHTTIVTRSGRGKDLTSLIARI